MHLCEEEGGSNAPKDEVVLMKPICCKVSCPFEALGLNFSVRGHFIFFEVIFDIFILLPFLTRERVEPSTPGQLAIKRYLRPPERRVHSGDVTLHWRRLETRGRHGNLLIRRRTRLSHYVGEFCLISEVAFLPKHIFRVK